MDYGLEHHALDSNPLNHRGPMEKLAAQGWVSHIFYHVSGYEYRAAKAFAEDRDDLYVSSIRRFKETINYHNEGRFFVHAQKDFYVGAATPEALQEIVDAVLALPQRKVEFAVRSAENARGASQLLRGKNHSMNILTEEESYTGSPIMMWSISVEDCVEAVHAKLTFG